MGLDQYLSRKSYIMGNFNRETAKFENNVKIEGVPLIEGGRVKEISEEAAYWRKANQIHNWFVENVQDGEDECKPHEVSLEQLQALVDACKTVLADHSKAEELLPTASGFFFGGTDYDESYFQDLQNTIEQIEPLLEYEKQLAERGKDENGDTIWVSYEYQSSW